MAHRKRTTSNKKRCAFQVKYAILRYIQKNPNSTICNIFPAVHTCHGIAKLHLNTLVQLNLLQEVEGAYYPTKYTNTAIAQIKAALESVGELDRWQ